MVIWKSYLARSRPETALRDYVDSEKCTRKVRLAGEIADACEDRKGSNIALRTGEFQGDEAYFRVNRGWHATAMTCAKLRARIPNDNGIFQ